MSATIYDVAERAAVSISTVSRALNSPNTVNSATRKRIHDAIDELGYVPKAEATARARRSNRRIGVLAPFFTYPSFVQRLRGIADALLEASYELVVYNADSPAHVSSYLESLPVARRLDGLIIISLLINDAAADRFQHHGLETVLIETSHARLSCVETDNLAGGRLAGEYLLERGHRRIAFVGGDVEIAGYTLRTSHLRYEGLRLAMAAAQVDSIMGEFRLDRATSAMAYQQSLALLRRADRPSAVFAASDTLALGVLKASRELNLRVPQDIAVIGFDDLDISEYMGLTTVCQSLEESGRLAVDLLLGRLASPDRSPQHVRLPLRVMPRETA